MEDCIIKFDSPLVINQNWNNYIVSEGEQQGLKWVCKSVVRPVLNMSTKKLEDTIFFSWKFTWDELHESKGIVAFEGTIKTKCWSQHISEPAWTIFHTDLHRPEIVITRKTSPHVSQGYYVNRARVLFEITPITETSESKLLDRIFAPSDLTDAVLVVNTKKMHVNKTIFSVHSEFFRALFGSSFKEKEMDEITIEDVEYEDFAVLLSQLTPNPVKPTCENIQSILELSDRFLIPLIPTITEIVLLSTEDLPFENKLVLADKYKMNTLLKNLTMNISHQADLKSIAQFNSYHNYSNETKVAILSRFLI